MLVKREFPTTIAAWLQTVDEDLLWKYCKEQQKKVINTTFPPNSIRKALEQIRESDPFKDIDDPVAWQREIRKDRVLSDRQ